MTASIQEIKQELNGLPPEEVKKIVLRLARFKKENKELLTYLLFEANQEDEYIRSIKEEITESFRSMNQSQLYFARKTIRKIVRIINKHVRISGSVVVEVELRLHFLETLRDSGLDWSRNTSLTNLYRSEWQKLYKAITALHEDLQFEYLRRADTVSV